MDSDFSRNLVLGSSGGINILSGTVCWEAFLSSLGVMAKGGQTSPSAFQMVPLGQGRTMFEFRALVIPLPVWLLCY